MAPKFVAAHPLHDEEAKQRFLPEARAAAALHHPKICTVLDVAEEGGKTLLTITYSVKVKRSTVPGQKDLRAGSSH